MIKTLLFTLALAYSATTWAGDDNGSTVAPLPDAGASALLLGLGVAALGAVRLFKR